MSTNTPKNQRFFLQISALASSSGRTKKIKALYSVTAELLQQNLTQFIFLINFINEKVGNRTNRDQQIISTFETDIIKMVLVFSISYFSINENCQGRKLSEV